MNVIFFAGYRLRKILDTCPWSRCFLRDVVRAAANSLCLIRIVWWPRYNLVQRSDNLEDVGQGRWYHSWINRLRHRWLETMETYRRRPARCTGRHLHRLNVFSRMSECGLLYCTGLFRCNGRRQGAAVFLSPCLVWCNDRSRIIMRQETNLRGTSACWHITRPFCRSDSEVNRHQQLVGVRNKGIHHLNRHAINLYVLHIKTNFCWRLHNRE